MTVGKNTNENFDIVRLRGHTVVERCETGKEIGALVKVVGKIIEEDAVVRFQNSSGKVDAFFYPINLKILKLYGLAQKYGMKVCECFLSKILSPLKVKQVVKKILMISIS